MCGHCFPQCGEPEDMFEALQQACKAGLKLDTVVCTGLMNACLMRRRFDVARQVFDCCAQQVSAGPAGLGGDARAQVE